MEKLGYVLTNGRVKNKVEYIEYVNNIELVDNTKPCLIVGLSEARKVASDKFSILNKKINDKLFWTFGRTEKRDEHEKDLINFYNYVLNKNLKNIKYYYINLLNIKYSVAKRLFNLCISSEIKYIYIWNDMIYILCNKNSVIGFSLKFTKFNGHSANKIIDFISSNDKNIVSSEINAPVYIKRKIKECRYVVPYIMSINGNT